MMKSERSAGVARLLLVLGAGAVLTAVVAVALQLSIGPFVEEAPPTPPTAEDLAALEARFQALHGVLDQLVEAEQFGNHVRVIRDSLLRQGDTLRVREMEREYGERGYRLASQIHPPLRGQTIYMSDSLVYISAWARRGKGFSAPWWYAGYVYASEPPSGGRHALYRHLDGRWYLFSIDDPFGLGGSD
jgi:hypothetical protein